MIEENSEQERDINDQEDEILDDFVMGYEYVKDEVQDLLTAIHENTDPCPNYVNWEHVAFINKAAVDVYIICKKLKSYYEKDLGINQISKPSVPTVIETTTEENDEPDNEIREAFMSGWLRNKKMLESLFNKLNEHAYTWPDDADSDDVDFVDEMCRDIRYIHKILKPYL